MSWFVVVACAALCLAFPAVEAGLAAVSIDYGAEWMKVGLVKPGVPMDIVLNRESQRKTPVCVSFRKGERMFGDPAYTASIKFPETSFRYLLNLLGQKVDSPLVKRFQKNFPYLKIEPDPVRNTVTFRVDDETVYTVEELVAMTIQNALDFSSAFAEQAINDTIITVPPYFNQAERKALIAAANIAGINLLQLMDTNLAVATNYGVFRRASFNSTTQYIIFYDMGAEGTTATVVAYTMVKDKESRTGAFVPQLEIKGVGYDRFLGSTDWDYRLREFILKKFTETAKPKGDVFSSSKALSKALKEAERVKRVLSANTETFAQIEGLFEEKDFRYKITRTEFEELTADLFARVAAPIKDALAAANLTTSDMSHNVLVGGGPRVPKIQDLLKEALGVAELGKNINSDEAAAMGGAFQGAVLTKGFKVQKFNVKGATLFPIEVEFKAASNHTANSTGAPEAVQQQDKVSKVTIFARSNAYPAKKALTFNHFTTSFDFNVSYGDLSFLSAESKQIVGEPGLGQYTFSGVEEAFAKHGDRAVHKGTKAHFRLDASGVLHMDKADIHFEIPPDTPKDESTLSKIGAAFSNLFSAGEEEKPSEEENDDDDGKPAGGEPQSSEDSTQKNEAPTQDDKKGDSSSSNDETSQKNEEGSKKEDEAKSEKREEAEKPSSDEEGGHQEQEKKSDESSAKDGKNATDTSDQKKEEAKVEPPKSPKILNLKESLSVSAASLGGVADFSLSQMDGIREKFAKLKEAEDIRRANAAAKNAVETFVYNTLDMISNDDFVLVSSETERETLQGELSAAGDWLYDEGADLTAAEYKDKLKALNTTAKPIFFRLSEYRNRPDAIKKLKTSITMCQEFVMKAKAMNANLTEGEDPWITEKEMTDLIALAKETSDWLANQTKLQDATPLTEDPPLTTSLIDFKASRIDRELIFLVKKPKPRAKPKPKIIKINETASANTTAEGLDPLERPLNSTQDDTEMPSDKTTSTKAPHVDLPETPTSDDASSEKDSSSKESAKSGSQKSEKTESTKKPPQATKSTQKPATSTKAPSKKETEKKKEPEKKESEKNKKKDKKEPDDL